jgi:hypothetical protein
MQNDPNNKQIPPQFDEDEDLWLLNAQNEEQNFLENKSDWHDDFDEEFDDFLDKDDF